MNKLREMELRNLTLLVCIKLHAEEAKLYNEANESKTEEHRAACNAAAEVLGAIGRALHGVASELNGETI